MDFSRGISVLWQDLLVFFFSLYVKTPESFMAEMRKRNKNPRSYVSYAFDSVWAAALLFQASLSWPKEFHPENAEFGSITIADLYAYLLSQTQFQGMTVNIIFIAITI